MQSNNLDSRKINAVVVVLLVVLIIAFNYSNFEGQVNLHLNTWASKSLYDKIEQVKADYDRIEGPVIFAGYNIDAYTISYYENVLKMELGNAYFYYGKLDFLRQRQQTPDSFFQSIDEKNLNTYYYDKLSDLLKPPSSFTIALITPDLYIIDGLSAALLKTYYVGDGIYLIQVGEGSETQSVPSSVVIAYTDFQNFSKGFYNYPTDWAYSGSILEYYEDSGNESISANVTYPIWLLHGGENSIRVHLFDAYAGWGNLSFVLDNVPIGNYTYRDTGLPCWYNMTVNSFEEGSHSLTVNLNSKYRGIVRLDVIQITI